MENCNYQQITSTFMLPHPPLIIPAVGRGEERKIQKTIDAYHEAARRIAACRPETIVLISPHQVMYADYFHISPGKSADGDFGQFRAPQEKMEVSYDIAFVEKLCTLADEKDLPAGTLGEHDRKLDHGTMVPLYFVNQYWTDYQLVRVGLSGLPLSRHYELGQCIQETANALKRKVVIIASGDLSHRLKEDGPYGYREEGPAYDARIMDVMGRGDFEELLEFPEDFCEKAGECGHRSFTIMAGALDKRKVKAEKLSYEGTFGVGYGICCYQVCEDAYVQLARKTIETYIRTGEKIKVPDGLPQEMYERRAGTFVSIKENGNLRGCIGTIQAVQASIAEEIINNAISAAVKDPRFYPIEPEELDKLTISVDVLGETERIESPDELDVQRYGVIVTKGYKRGLLLPNLEGVDAVEEQIAIAKNKAGISAKEEVELERFEVVRHSPYGGGSMKTVCQVCMHHCALSPGQMGICRARKNENGQVVCTNYGQITSIALDPIEKKPLHMFYPGSLILSVGSFGCNLRCPFCQNHEISMTDSEGIYTMEMTPRMLADKASAYKDAGNIGVAYTYNEPLIGWEYVRDTAALVKAAGMKNVLVTNGTAELSILEKLLPYIDAMNIDLKGFRQEYYEKLGGSLETVKKFIIRAAADCHVELTTLIVPGENDEVSEMEEEAAWIASVEDSAGKKIPLHVTRFFPRYHMLDKEATDIAMIHRLADNARKYLNYVFVGNC